MKLVATVLAAVLAFGAPALADEQGQSGFVSGKGSQFFLDGKPLRFTGSNNYYLMYKSRLMVDHVYADAKAAGFTVLRT